MGFEVSETEWTALQKRLAVVEGLLAERHEETEQATGSVAILANSCAHLAALMSLIFGADAVLHGHCSVLDKACANMAANPEASGGVARGATAIADMVRKLCEGMTAKMVQDSLINRFTQVAETGARGADQVGRLADTIATMRGETVVLSRAVGILLAVESRRAAHPRVRLDTLLSPLTAAADFFRNDDDAESKQTAEAYDTIIAMLQKWTTQILEPPRMSAHV